MLNEAINLAAGTVKRICEESLWGFPENGLGHSEDGGGLCKRVVLCVVGMGHITVRWALS